MTDHIATLATKFCNKTFVNPDLTRQMVSFQANKTEPFYRWFKYREGFSKPLLDYLLADSGVGAPAVVLDPFCGSGATLAAAMQVGLTAIGMELLPLGVLASSIRRARGNLSRHITAMQGHPWMTSPPTRRFPHLRITAGAFDEVNEDQIARYRSWSSGLDEEFRQFCDLVAISVLEDASFTRKDGQYLRWDNRAPRERCGNFRKDAILPFNQLIDSKLAEMASDLSLIAEEDAGAMTLYAGSNFAALDSMEDASVGLAITSPPYCNRYDYTRTYALELAYLGVGEDEIRELRQALLSCTVEHKRKDLSKVVRQSDLTAAHNAVDACTSVATVVAFLENEAAQKRLNNPGIVTMVQGYFTESAIHIAQMARVMQPGALYYVVNDNVSYNGFGIPVDWMLSDIAERLGFACECIWTIGNGKGNSSQQMAKHGRVPLRKCIYKWRKTSATKLQETTI